MKPIIIIIIGVGALGLLAGAAAWIKLAAESDGYVPSPMDQALPSALAFLGWLLGIVSWCLVSANLNE